MTQVIAADSKTPIVVGISEFSGKTGLDIRKQYFDKAGDMKPTRRGIFLELTNGKGDIAAEVLEAALAELRAWEYSQQQAQGDLDGDGS